MVTTAMPAQAGQGPARAAPVRGAAPFLSSWANAVPRRLAVAVAFAALAPSFLLTDGGRSGGFLARAAAFEPAGNQIMFGAWIDTSDGFNDRPAWFNQRMGYNVPVYQFAQNIPLPEYNWTSGEGGPAPTAFLEQSGTDAALFLTVYPVDSFAAVTDNDFTILGNQLLAYETDLNRTVFLRYAPEMQGTWNAYGFQPLAFVEHWRRMYAAIKAIAPNTIMVWAPNTSQGYPYGQTPSNATEVTALDTDGDGSVTGSDDAYAPYYPGDEYVDWIGLSIYFKGTNDATNANVVQDPGYCSQIIRGYDPTFARTRTEWYTTYCANKPDKACMFAESGAAYHVNTTGGATQAAIQQAWHRDCVTNTTFYDEFPRIKMVMSFEHAKYESDSGVEDYRDFRLTNATDTLASFLADLAPVASRFYWAGPRAIVATATATGNTPTATGPAATQTAGASKALVGGVVGALAAGTLAILALF